MTARQVSDAPVRRHVYVVDRFPSYSETFVSTELSSLIARGTPASVYSIHPPQAKFEAVASYVARPLSALRMLTWAVPGVVLLICNLFRGLRFDMRSLPKLLFAASHAARLAATLLLRRKTQSTQLVLHAHFLARPADVVALASIWLPGVPVLITSHAGDAKDRRDPKLRSWRIAKADHILAASQFVLSNLGNETTRASVVHCGIETSKLRPSSPPSTTNGIVIVTVARLIPTKGYLRATSISSALAKISSEPVTWHIVGEGPMREEIEAVVDGLPSEGVKVVLHGALDHESTLRLVEGSHVFLLPSQPTKNTENAGDGIPVAILEGMALGKLVVTTEAGGIPEAVEDAQTGLLITTDSDQEIAERILKTVNDAELYRSITKQATTKIREEFEATRSADAIERIVTSIISDRATKKIRHAKAGAL